MGITVRNKEALERSEGIYSIRDLTAVGMKDRPRKSVGGERYDRD